MSEPVLEVSERGYTMRAWHGDKGVGRVQIIHETRGLVRDVECAGYKIWTVAAHFGEIVDDLEATPPEPTDG
jgi:hypothetical protein